MLQQRLHFPFHVPCHEPVFLIEKERVKNTGNFTGKMKIRGLPVVCRILRLVVTTIASKIFLHHNLIFYSTNAFYLFS